MGLFDKKYCDVCGEKIRFLGNRKLEDGNLCKDCADKLSPWFSERRRSTAADIKAQLQYRAENQLKVNDFATSRTYGEYGRLYVDDQHGQFAVARYGSTGLSGNPDVLNFAQVTGAEVKVHHSKTEEKTRDAEGKSVSYDPPRFTHSYQFEVVIHVSHPWFDEMSFRCNRDNVTIETGKPIELPAILGKAATIYTPAEPDTDHCKPYQDALAMAETICRVLRGEPEEIPAPLEEPAPAPVEEAPQPRQCPFCTATITVKKGEACPYCGGIG